MTAGAREAGDVVVFVEIPAGSRNKYELDEATGEIFLDRRPVTAASRWQRVAGVRQWPSSPLPRTVWPSLERLETDGPRLHAMPPPRRAVDYGAAVYGSVLVAALVAAEFESDVDARAMTLTLFATTIVYWLAHVWSDALGERITGAAITLRRLRGIAVAQWPLVEAGFVPAALIALSWIGVYSRETGAVLALAAAVLQLFGWGFIAAWRTGQRLAVAFLSSVVNGALGGAIVVLEVLVLH